MNILCFHVQSNLECLSMSLIFLIVPFDYHTCDLNFGASGNEAHVLKLNAPMIDHKNQSVSHHDGLLHMRQYRLPFDIALESLEPFEYVQRGLNYSYTGMRLHLTRNDIGILIGGYYGPTAVFSTLSLVSYSIKADIVSTYSKSLPKTICNSDQKFSGIPEK